LRSATEPIDDTSTGKLMEGVLAAFAQFDNDVRSDRTRAGMKAGWNSDDGCSWRRSAT
jgi:DNA invertase Pin-like site-specific DNA recombinase